MSEILKQFLIYLLVAILALVLYANTAQAAHPKKSKEQLRTERREREKKYESCIYTCSESCLPKTKVKKGSV